MSGRVSVMPRALYCALAPAEDVLDIAARADRQRHVVAEHQRRRRPHRGRGLAVARTSPRAPASRARRSLQRCRARLRPRSGVLLVSASMCLAMTTPPVAAIALNLRRRTRAASPAIAPAMCDHPPRARPEHRNRSAGGGRLRRDRPTDGGTTDPAMRAGPAARRAVTRTCRRRRRDAAGRARGDARARRDQRADAAGRDDRSGPPGAAAAPRGSRPARPPAPTGARAGRKTASRGSPTTTS